MARFRGASRTVEELLQDIVDRMHMLESRRTSNLGSWVLKETSDGRVVLSNPARGVEHVLIDPREDIEPV